jgi:hypothetical protein
MFLIGSGTGISSFSSDLFLQPFYVFELSSQKMFKNYFLKASAWQLCLMMVAPYAVYKFTDFGHNPIDWGFLLFYFLVVALGWVYSIGIAANEKLEPRLQMSSIGFRVAILVPFIYVPVFVYMFLIPLSQGEVAGPPRGFMFLHFGSIFAAAYSFWFAAKQFTTLIKNMETSFADYYPAFMGFWFSVIGVWFFQPKVTNLFNPDKG